MALGVTAIGMVLLFVAYQFRFVPLQHQFDHKRFFEFLQYEDYTGALRFCNDAIAADPRNAEAYQSRSHVYRNRSDQAIDDMDSQTADLHAAMSDVTTAVELVPQNGSYLSDRITTRRQLLHAIRRSKPIPKQELDALERFQDDDINHAIELMPDDTFMLLERAERFREKKKRKEALADCNRLLKIDSLSWRGYRERAFCCLLLGDRKHAEADFREAIRIDTSVRSDAEKAMPDVFPSRFGS
jgi:tetratricopeptide (TPR) repeat protein